MILHNAFLTTDLKFIVVFLNLLNRAGCKFVGLCSLITFLDLNVDNNVDVIMFNLCALLHFNRTAPCRYLWVLPFSGTV